MATDGAATSAALDRIARAARAALDASGVAITLMGGDGWREVVTATDPQIRRLEEVQVVCGEGPGIDAFRFGSPVLVDDLEDRTWGAWSGYAPTAQAAGVRAVFAFPLHVGAGRLGVLNLYRGSAGSMTAAELSDATTLAEITVATLLDGQESALPGHPAAGLEEAFDYRIYQAQGMVGAQLDVGLVEAMARLRAYALRTDRTLVAVARAVLAGDLQLGEEEP